MPLKVSLEGDHQGILDGAKLGHQIRRNLEAWNRPHLRPIQNPNPTLRLQASVDQQSLFIIVAS
jgi:hypothetical protein